MAVSEQVSFGKTPTGQLLYDLAFTNLADAYIARKHHLPVREVRRMRRTPDMKKLRTKVKADRRCTT